MNMHMIATVYIADKRIGFRILDVDTGKTLDVAEANVASVLRQGQKIKNIELNKGKVKGSNGDLERYAKIYDMNGPLMDGKSPVVVINQIGESGFTLSDFKGTLIKVKSEDAVTYAKNMGIANGKVSSKGDTEFISAISGTYEKVAMPTQVKAPVKTAAPVAPKAEVKPAQAVVEPTKQPEKTDLAFNDKQKSVLKDYYTWNPIDPSEADKEIGIMNEALRKKDASTYTKFNLLYSILTKLGSNFKIAEAYGADIGTFLVQFSAVGLTFPKSLLNKVAEYTSDNTSSVYKVVFSEFVDEVDAIFKAEDNTFEVAAKLYLTYLGTREILGEYKGFDTEAEANMKKFVKQYAKCTKYTFDEARALIGALDSLKIASNKILKRLNWRLSKEYSKAVLYFANMYQDIPAEERKQYITEAVAQGILDATEFNRLLCDNSVEQELNWKFNIPNKTLEESPIPEVKSGIYISTPIMLHTRNRINRVETIEDIYRCQLAIVNVGLDKACDNFSAYFEKTCYEINRLRADRDRAELQRVAEEARIKREEAERERQRQEEIERQQRERELEQRLAEQRRLEEAERQAKAAEQMKQIAELTQLELDIAAGKPLDMYNPDDVYKELRKRFLGNTKDICFKIADDMMARKLTHKDMSPKQLYRLNEAIGKMYKEGTGMIKRPEPIKDEYNNRYELIEHPELKAKVEEIINRSDKVEMSEVLKSEPRVLKICYSVLRYGRVTDRQLRCINNALDILNNQ